MSDDAARWNETHPIGTRVVLTDDFGARHETETRSVAWLLGDGSPVVKVRGWPGGYALERIRADTEKGDET